MFVCIPGSSFHFSIFLLRIIETEVNARWSITHVCLYHIPHIYNISHYLKFLYNSKSCCVSHNILLSFVLIIFTYFRNKLSYQFMTEEKCSFCSAPVQFESPEIAMCNGSDIIGGSSERHKLSRCAVSMRLCSISHPVWFCICCQRSVNKLPPKSFFSISTSPLDVSCENVSLDTEEVNIPRCPFCGIMLQRQLPEFLLSINPV
jgi:hypothetical protein